MSDEIPEGFCQCGCGQKTNLAPQSATKRGLIKGKPFKFLHNHHHKQSNNYGWKGGKLITKRGYVLVSSPNHPRANPKGYVYEHILVMEEHIGRFLNKTEVVHHIDENPQNNYIGNLMIFANSAMHSAFHRRLRAFKATGHWDWLHCNFCKQYDDPVNLYVNSKDSYAFHRACRNTYYKNRYRHQRPGPKLGAKNTEAYSLSN